MPKYHILQNKSINQVAGIIILFTALVTLFITSMLLLNTYIEHKQELKNLEQNYIDSQKKIIKDATNRAIRYISHKHKTATDSVDINLLQNQLVDTIENMRDLREGSGYIFIYTFDGINIADPILKYNAGKNLIDFKDPNGKLVIKELIDVSREDGGGFVEYVWNKPTTNRLTDKISYAISYEPWGWMVGSGVYLDDIESVLQRNKEQYRARIAKYILQISIFAIILFFSGILVSRYFTSLVSSDIKLIKETLAGVADSYGEIDMSGLKFREFKEVSSDINSMIHEIRDLNQNLENRVQMRTNELEVSEKFANTLVQSQDRFIKNAIHEINTPLSIIIANIDLFKLKSPANRYITKIEAGSKIIHNIYNDLSYMVKKDRVKYPKIDINLSDFLLYRVDFFDEVAVGNTLTLCADITPDIVISFNETELQRVIDNSISNAIKYSWVKTEIDIELQVDGGRVVLDITNRGESIKEPDRLFQRYYRENQNRGGFGIGLHIIREICDKNSVEIELFCDNELTTFRYIFQPKSNHKTKKAIES